VTLSLDRVDELPYAHPAVSGVRALAGVLAPRERWSQRDLARLTKRFATRAADELYLVARFDPVHPWRLRLAVTEQVEVWLLTWTPWQGTGDHDHGGALGAYTVLHGELTETWTDRPDRSKGSLRPAGSSESFGPDRVHVVQNRGTMEAISVHAYSPPRLTGPDLI
jgi:predicted metal-dependent enzyme (double-stranded beta helix superfamily)